MTSAFRRAVSALALTGVVFTAGCTIGDEEQAQEERVPARSLTMAFGGDVMFIMRIGKLYIIFGSTLSPRGKVLNVLSLS